MIVTVKERILVSSISIPSSITVTPGSTYSFSATVSPSNATDKTLYWSSNSDIASISNGYLTAYYPGTAIITVSSREGNATATCTVNIVHESVSDSTSQGIVFAFAAGDEVIGGLLPNSVMVDVSPQMLYFNQPYNNPPLNLCAKGAYISSNIVCMVIENEPTMMISMGHDADVSISGESVTFTNGVDSQTFSAPASASALPYGHSHLYSQWPYYLRCGAWNGMYKLNSYGPITVTYSCLVSCSSAILPRTIEKTYTFTPNINSLLNQ